MKSKKSPKADLENKRGLFLHIGLVISLGVCVLAFEWKTPIEPIVVWDTTKSKIVDVDTIIVTYNTVKPPPPLPKVADVILIVDNEVELDQELEILTTDVVDKIIFDYSVVINREDPTEEVDNGIVFFAEDMPEFPGGEAALRRFLANAIKYPAVAVEMGMQGRVYINFVVDKDGSIVNATIYRGVYSSLDNEALRVVNSMPKWRPGRQGGKPVRVSYTVPISFVLQ